MSERGSFTTEYIYCDDCFAVAKRVLLNDPDLDAVQVGEFPIIAGKVHATYAGGEFVHFLIDTFVDEFPCHPLRIAVLSDSHGSTVFEVQPDGNVIHLCTKRPTRT
jgi:hypothetical protein